MPLRVIYISLLILLASFASFSQDGNTYELGVNVGVASFQTDYGTRGDVRSSIFGNTGFAVGGAFYMSFYDREIKWNSVVNWMEDHFKVKAEISYMKANLEHHLDEASENLLAMHGTASVVNMGLIGEYHLLPLSDYTYNNNSGFSPFVGFGLMFNYSNPTFETSMGDYRVNPSILPEKYRVNAVFVDPEFVGSILFSTGTRYKAGYDSDFILDLRWQYFLSNNIDALDPKHFSNKYNDWMFFLSFGYVYYLN